MYTRMNNSGVEDICYEQEHVEKVLAAIQKNFDQYFDRFLDSSGGKGVSIEVSRVSKKSLESMFRRKRKIVIWQQTIRLSYVNPLMSLKKIVEITRESSVRAG